MNTTTRTIALALATTAGALTITHPAAAEQATCVVTAQPQDLRSYHLAYTDQEGLHTLIAHQDGRRLDPTDFEIPADFHQVLWATKQGRIDGPDSFYDRLQNGGGALFLDARDALGFRLQSLGLPQQLTDAGPYVITLLALILMSGRFRKARAAAVA